MTSKREKDEIEKLVGDYFCDVILPTCQMGGYKMMAQVKEGGKEDSDKTFSISVSFPYRTIELYIRKGAIDYYRKKDWKSIRCCLFHEAFHIFLWKYKEYAKARFADSETMYEMEEDMADRFSFIVEDLYSQISKIK